MFGLLSDFTLRAKTVLLDWLQGYSQLWNPGREYRTSFLGGVIDYDPDGVRTRWQEPLEIRNG